jgi:uncharacterized membrane protein YfcA
LAIVFLAMLVQSTFSFGAALVSLPLLVLVVDVRTATVLMTLLSCSIAVIIVARKWRDVELGDAWRLIVLALVVITFTLLSLVSLKAIRLTHPSYAFIFGFVSGIFGGAYNISGPPVVLYGTLVDWGSERFRATVQSYALFANVFAIAAHTMAGNLTREVSIYYVCSLPIVVVSVWLGSVIHRAIPAERYALVVKVLLLILGVRLLYAAVM